MQVKPHLSKWLFRVTWAIPVLLGSGALYLSSSARASLQVVLIVAGIALVAPVLLTVLLRQRRRSILRHSRIAIVRNRRLVLEREDEQYELALSEIESIRMTKLFWLWTLVQINRTQAKSLSFLMGGTLQRKDERILEDTLQQHGILIR